MKSSVIIIGAGVAGLSAGCYGRMNGFETEIFELHDKPGGLCTAWERQGYTFDGCIDWLIGSGEGSSFRRIWEELGAVQGRRFVYRDEYLRYEGTGGKTLILYTDVDRLERHLKELAPEDAAVIAQLTGSIRKLIGLEMPIETPGLFKGLKLILGALPALGVMRKYGRVSLEDFARRFSNPFLREAFTALQGDMAGFPAAVMMFPLASLEKRDAGYPIGGSLAFARAIERRYLDLGGRIHYRARVAKILTAGDRAAGVRLADGTEFRADYVISAADGHATIFGMLEGKYLDDKIRGYYDGGLPPFPPMIQVSLGVKRDLANEPSTVIFPLAEPVVIAGQSRGTMGCRHYGKDPTLAPAGHSVIVVSFMTDYEYWRGLAADHGRYQEEKQRIAEAVVDRLDRRYPGLKDQVAVVDVATPMTYERYTANWRASFEGWLPTTETMGMMFGKGLPKTLPGLANFSMIGQWTTIGGGLPPAAKEGRDVIKKLCQQEGRKFVTSVP